METTVEVIEPVIEETDVVVPESPSQEEVFKKALEKMNEVEKPKKSILKTIQSYFSTLVFGCSSRRYVEINTPEELKTVEPEVENKDSV